MGTHLADPPTQLKEIQKSTHIVNAPQTYVRMYATVGTHIGYTYASRNTQVIQAFTVCIYVRAYVRMCTHTQCIYIHSSQTSVEYNRTWRELYTDHHMHTAPMYAYKLTAAYNTAEHIPYTRIEKLVQCTFSLCEKTLMASDTESAQTTHNAMRTIPQGHMRYTTFATQNDSV